MIGMMVGSFVTGALLAVFVTLSVTKWWLSQVECPHCERLVVARGR